MEYGEKKWTLWYFSSLPRPTGVVRYWMTILKIDLSCIVSRNAKSLCEVQLRVTDGIYKTQ